MTKKRRKMSSVRYITALFIIGIFGSLGVLLDIDHLIAVVDQGLPVTLFNLSHHGSRFAHLPVLVSSGVVLCIALTYLVGWITLERGKHV
jgi:hypothetical protein